MFIAEVAAGRRCQAFALSDKEGEKTVELNALQDLVAIRWKMYESVRHIHFAFFTTGSEVCYGVVYA